MNDTNSSSSSSSSSTKAASSQAPATAASKSSSSIRPKLQAPSRLFDPSNPVLLQLFDQSRFPAAPFDGSSSGGGNYGVSPPVLLTGLVACGMRREVNLQVRWGGAGGERGGREGADGKGIGGRGQEKEGEGAGGEGEAGGKQEAEGRAGWTGHVQEAQ